MEPGGNAPLAGRPLEPLCERRSSRLPTSCPRQLGSRLQAEERGRWCEARLNDLPVTLGDRFEESPKKRTDISLRRRGGYGIDLASRIHPFTVGGSRYFLHRALPRFRTEKKSMTTELTSLRRGVSSTTAAGRSGGLAKELSNGAREQGSGG